MLGSCDFSASNNPIFSRHDAYTMRECALGRAVLCADCKSQLLCFHSSHSFRRLAPSSSRIPCPASRRHFEVTDMQRRHWSTWTVDETFSYASHIAVLNTQSA